MLSIEDATDTLVVEMFLEKEPGYDEWFQARVAMTLAAFESGGAQASPHDDVMTRVWERVQAKARPVFA